MANSKIGARRPRRATVDELLSVAAWLRGQSRNYPNSYDLENAADCVASFAGRALSISMTQTDLPDGSLSYRPDHGGDLSLSE